MFNLEFTNFVQILQSKFSQKTKSNFILEGAGGDAFKFSTQFSKLIIVKKNLELKSGSIFHQTWEPMFQYICVFIFIQFILNENHMEKSSN